MHTTKRGTIVFRAGEERDQATIAAMTRELWGGGDYLAKVWDEWVAAPDGLLQVGLLDDELVVTGRLVELAPGEWWLEGMRVHPDHQGKGLGTILHHHLVELALAQPGARRVGLATSWENEKVAHLARRSGMALLGEYRFLKCDGEGAPPPRAPVTRWQGEVAALHARLLAGAWLQAGAGYFMDGWVARGLTARWLAGVIATGEIWQCGEAIALTGSDGHGRQRKWLFMVEGGSPAEQVALVEQARYLAGQMPEERALRCFAPLTEGLQGPLFEGGLADEDDDEFRVRHFVRVIAR